MVEFKVSGGTKMDAELKRIAAKMKGRVVKVGFQNGAQEVNGTLVAQVAATNEYGRPDNNQPPRPFFRRAIAARKDAWARNAATALKGTDYDERLALSMVGQGMKDDVQASIRELVSPPLSPVTIERKGFSKPLIETSTMLNNVTYAVDEGDKR